MRRTPSEARTRLDVVWQAASGPSPSGASLEQLLREESLAEITSLLVVREGMLAPTAEVERVIAALPALASVTILAGGQASPDDASWSALRDACGRRDLRLRAAFVLDDRADAPSALAARDTTLSAVIRASRAHGARGLPVSWWIPLSPVLVFRLETLFSLARDEDVEPILVSSEALSSLVPGAGAALGPDERLFAWDFVTYRLLEEERHRLSEAGLHYYRHLSRLLAEPSRPLARETAAVLRGSPRGWELSLEDRPALGGVHAALATGMARRASRMPRLGATVAHAADVAVVLRDGGRGLVRWALARVVAPGTRGERTASDARFSSVLLIGAYGGEHVGDAAILGGVLWRIHERHGTTQAVLLSQRPAHTRHLVEMLDVPVALDVRPYEHSHIRQCLERVDAVVYAGGPLTDLPKQLVRHLYAASLARGKKKPFIVEGIGVGPFVRRPSAWVGRKIVEMATHLTVRTSDDGRQPQVMDLGPEVGRDPAFDYLATRPRELTRLPAADRRRIDQLLDGTEGRPLVGVNLRPIRHLYTVGAGGKDPVEFTRAIESRFEEQLASGLRRFHDEVTPRPCFVFYPMNAIQFGLSDLRSAYRLARRLRDDVEFRVWEGDASLDGVVALLRNLDIVVSMRFHAVIFALSQERPVIGIDYRIGKRDKVASLLDDFGQSENCTRVDELTAEWLCSRLRALWNAAPKGAALKGTDEG